MKIRSRLLLLMLGTLIPIIAFSGVMLVLFNRQTRAATEKGLVETARALSVAVDQQISASISGLEGLSTSEHLTAGDLAEFHRAARAILVSQPVILGWTRQMNRYVPTGAVTVTGGGAMTVTATLDGKSFALPGTIDVAWQFAS